VDYVSFLFMSMHWLCVIIGLDDVSLEMLSKLCDDSIILFQKRNVYLVVVTHGHGGNYI
jgi:hypothetical protein